LCLNIEKDQTAHRSLPGCLHVVPEASTVGDRQPRSYHPFGIYTGIIGKAKFMDV